VTQMLKKNKRYIIYPIDGFLFYLGRISPLLVGEILPSIMNGGFAGSNPLRGTCGRMAPWSGTHRVSITVWAGGTILLVDRVRGLRTSGLTGKSSTTGTMSFPVFADNSLATRFNSGLMPTGAESCCLLEGGRSLLGSLPADSEPRCTLGGCRSLLYAALTSSCLLVTTGAEEICRAKPLVRGLVGSLWAWYLSYTELLQPRSYGA
jgi:hypothetical protein